MVGASGWNRRSAKARLFRWSCLSAPSSASAPYDQAHSCQRGQGNASLIGVLIQKAHDVGLPQIELEALDCDLELFSAQSSPRVARGQAPCTFLWMNAR